QNSMKITASGGSILRGHQHHVITERSADTLKMRREYALNEAELETKTAYKVIWLGMAQQLDTHIKCLDSRRPHG
ncbi:hypothetical protein, partial [Burkholderia sp. LMG 13014]|uniref:hypothetical protein n=1 Tax=Burkholderia sp. LMG 13014 TaxID=2709306 RepID=UPI0019651E4E